MNRNLALAIVLLAAFFLRGFAFFKYTYPTGADWGHHSYFADLYLEEGRFPEKFPYYQLGAPRWSNLPGGAVTYSLVSAISGASAFDLAALTSLLAVIEVAGVYLLAFRVFRRSDAAFVAALACAFHPSTATMATWSAYANIIALAFIPYAFVAFLDYWEHQSPARLALAVVTICGAASIHHLSTLWFGLALILFCTVYLIRQPGETVRRLMPLVAAGVGIGLPVLQRIFELYYLFTSAGPSPAMSHELGMRVSWAGWTQTVSAISLLFLLGGVAGLLVNPRYLKSHRLLIGCYLLVSSFLTFGWLFGVESYYVRGLYFFSVPVALGAGSFVFMWPRRLCRTIVATVVIASLGVGTLYRADASAAFYECLTPGVIEGAEWIREISEEEDVVVVGGFLGFHMPRLLTRPVMVAIPESLGGNPDDFPTASDAFKILMGLPGMEEALDKYRVKFIMIRARGVDLPDPARSRAVAALHPRLRLLFQNEDVLIYGVDSP